MAAPLSIPLPSQPFDVAFHPTEPLVCAGLISGSVQLDRFKGSSTGGAPGGSGDGPSCGGPVAGGFEPQRCWRKKGHSAACRAVAFMDQGQALLSASSDKSLILRDTATGQRTWTNADAHVAAVNRLAALSETTVASGDDEGHIKVWDVRQPSCCAAMSVHEDFVADMHHAEQKGKLLAVSGDGTLSVFDLKRFKKEARSEYAEDELLSVTVVKNGRKVICGSQEGVLLLYSWGHFNDCSDRFPGHPHSIDALVKLSEDAVITGCQDGIIRVVSILPNSFEGVIGQHMDCPIERLALSQDSCSLASASHDNTVKIWDVSGAGRGEGEGGNRGGSDEEEEWKEGDLAGPGPGEGEWPSGGGPPGGKARAGAKRAKAEEGGDSSEEDEDVGKQKPKKANKKVKKGKGKAAMSSNFFADL